MAAWGSESQPGSGLLIHRLRCMAMLRVSEILICLKVHLFFSATLDEPLQWLGLAGACGAEPGLPLARPKSEK